MNKYFNDQTFKSLNVNKEFEPHCELFDLEDLYNMEVELLLLNPLVPQDSEKNPIYRPPTQIFKNNQELIFAGCSQTHGDHICPPLAKNGSHEMIWGFRVAKDLGLDAINLGIGAEGIYRIVQRLISHFKHYGNPKTLLCLFPDPYRFTSPKDKKNLIGKFTSGTYEFLEGTFHTANDVQSIPAFAKRPYVKEEVISRMIPLFFNMQAVHVLEQYCDSSGIKFLWGSWDPNTNRIAKAMRYYNKDNFKYFIDLDENGVDWKTTDCHKEIYDQYPTLFEVGIDSQHMGMHRHAHIAESFKKVLQK